MEPAAVAPHYGIGSGPVEERRWVAEEHQKGE
jgi:hypothetical protein